MRGTRQAVLPADQRLALSAPPRRLSRRPDPSSGDRDGPSDLRSIIGHVQWTPVYIGFLLYIFAIVTYRAPIATPAMILASIGLLVQQGKLRFPPLLLWFGLYLLWALFGYTQTAYSGVVWQRIVDYSKLWLIALVAVNALRTPGQIRFFTIFFLGCFATHPARGTIFNYLGGFTEFGRAAWNHVFGNPNDMAALTFFPLALAAVLLKDQNRWVRLGAQVSIAVLPVVILFTQSRGAFLALALFALLTWSGQRRKLRALAILAVVAGVAVLASPAGVWERMSDISEGTEADSSSRQRYAIWQIAREIIRNHPETGVGLGAYKLAHEQYAPQVETEVAASGMKDTHSTYLNVAAETGYPGLVIFLTMVSATIFGAERARRKVKKTAPIAAAQLWYLEAALIAYMVAAVFGSFAHLSFLYIHLAFLAALIHAISHSSASVPPLRRRRLRPALPAPAT